MVDSALKGIWASLFAVGIGTIVLIQWERIVRWDILVLVLLVLLMLTMKDRWIAVLGTSIVLSYFMTIPRTVPATKTLVTTVMFLLAIEKMSRMDRRIYYWPTLAIMFSASIVAVVYAVRYDITTFFPIGNQILSGPMFAICSALFYPISTILALWFAVVALLSTSTTAALCLVVAYSPILVTKKRRTAIMAVEAIALAAFAFFVDSYHAFSARMDMIGTAISLGRERIFGWGLGSFYYLFPSLIGPNSEGKYWGQAHNDILQLFFEAGYVPFFIACAFCIYHVMKSPFKMTLEQKAAHGAISAFIVFCMLGFPFHFAPSAALFGVVYAHNRGLK